MSRQCQGTTIERNFEVGASLSMSFAMSGDTPMAAVCGLMTSVHEENSEGAQAESIKAADTSRSTNGQIPGRLLVGGNETLCADGNEGVVTWTWGESVASFALGPHSRVRFSNGARLDGAWSPLEEGLSTANAKGELVTAVGKFESRAVYSALFFFADDEEAADRATADGEDDNGE